MNYKIVKVMYDVLRFCGYKVLDEYFQFGFINQRLLILIIGEYVCSQI